MKILLQCKRMCNVIKIKIALILKSAWKELVLKLVLRLNVD